MTKYEKIRNKDKGEMLKRSIKASHDELYADPTHFLYELLQNAEDALGELSSRKKIRTVRFKLSDDALIFSHYGKPFNDEDVDSICDIRKSTKNDNDTGTIGKFGIGFKSVYEFTETPHISSGNEHFEIRNYVEPQEITPLAIKDGQTIIKLPFNRKDRTAGESKSEIEKGFGNFDAQSILFLRHITRIEWQTENENSGFLERTEKQLDKQNKHVRMVTIRSSLQDKAESWLIFDRDVHNDEKDVNSLLEIGFLCTGSAKNWSVIPATKELNLSVYFPTEQETHLKFHVQGRFNTTKTRERIIANTWKNHLITETGEILIDALRWLKKNKKLDRGVFRCLPTDEAFFTSNKYPYKPSLRLFAPVAERLVKAFQEEELLPTSTRGFCSAPHARYPDDIELATLFKPAQLGDLYEDQTLRWISVEKCSGIRPYLTSRVGIEFIYIDNVIEHLNESFLEKQPDSWIRKFYEFLSENSYSPYKIKQQPILRLEDGTHVKPSPNVYLPPKKGKISPDCVKQDVMKSKKAREFVESLGLVEPDIIRPVLKLLKSYQKQSEPPHPKKYKNDLEQILAALDSDVKQDRKNDLYFALRSTPIIQVDATGEASLKKPTEVYLPTDALKALIGDMEGVFFADEKAVPSTMYDWMKDCGAKDRLQVYQNNYEDPERINELLEAAKKSGYDTRYRQSPEYVDYLIDELKDILKKIDQSGTETRKKLAALLWDQLTKINKSDWHTANLKWSYRNSKQAFSSASIIKNQLNETAWIPDEDGNLKKPNEIFFFSRLGLKL